jgi:DNA-binding transcriptional regulator GbsR (MarR family)
VQVVGVAASSAIEEDDPTMTYLQDVKAEITKLQQKDQENNAATSNSIQQLEEHMKKIEDIQERTRQRMEAQMNAMMQQLLTMQEIYERSFAPGASKT